MLLVKIASPVTLRVETHDDAEISEGHDNDDDNLCELCDLEPDDDDTAIEESCDLCGVSDDEVDKTDEGDGLGGGGDGLGGGSDGIGGGGDGGGEGGGGGGGGAAGGGANGGEEGGSGGKRYMLVFELGAVLATLEQSTLLVTQPQLLS